MTQQQHTNYDDLTTEQLLDLIKNNDVNARSHLVTQHTKLVHFTINLYSYSYHIREPEDLYHDGIIGLITGIQEYSESLRNCALSTYVIPRIRNAINISGQTDNPVYRPLSAVRQYLEIQRTKERLKRKISPEELEIITGIPEQRQADVHRLMLKTIPFSNPSYDKVGSSYYRESHFSKHASHLIYQQRRIEERFIAKVTVDQALHTTKQLNDREKLILRLVYGLDNDIPLTLQKVGDDLGITRERVRQLLAKALRKLRYSTRWNHS